MNYIGGKYRLLNQILPLFPDQINCFVDLFAGGLDVSLNIEANNTICNDINCFIIDLFKFFQAQEKDNLIRDIHLCIEEFGLSKTNKDGYILLREEYNKTHLPLHLFLLICFGFNHQIRFNSNGNFNNPFGANRSSYNPITERNLGLMIEKIKEFNFCSYNFKDFPIDGLKPGDFLYADPPYLLSCGSYNDGKRGFEGWTEKDDMELFRMLDSLNEKGISFALSNVVRHKGFLNLHLFEWSQNYNLHHINANYSNSNYQATQSITEEVLITNY